MNLNFKKLFNRKGIKVKIPKLRKKISRRDFISLKLLEFKKWLDQSQSDNLVKNYRGYVDDITDGAVIKAKKLIKDGENIDEVISYLAESLKNKLTHETTSKLKEVLSLIDKDTAQKVQNIFKK